MNLFWGSQVMTTDGIILWVAIHVCWAIALRIFQKWRNGRLFGGNVARSSQACWWPFLLDQSPGQTNSFGFGPSPSNYIVPGKRPQSSIASSIAENLETGEITIATGSAGGSRIITATLQELYHYIGKPVFHVIRSRNCQPKWLMQIRSWHPKSAPIIRDGMTSWAGWPILKWAFPFDLLSVLTILL